MTNVESAFLKTRLQIHEMRERESARTSFLCSRPKHNACSNMCTCGAGAILGFFSTGGHKRGHNYYRGAILMLCIYVEL